MKNSYYEKYNLLAYMTNKNYYYKTALYFLFAEKQLTCYSLFIFLENDNIYS